MTSIRRSAVLLGLTASVIVGSSIPASATFSDTVSSAASLRTTTVAAPTDLQISVRCEGSELLATVTWTRALTTPRVSGYAINASIDGDPLSVRAGATASSYTHRMARPWYAFSVPVQVTVTTDTEYRWTKASAPLTTTVTTC